VLLHTEEEDPEEETKIPEPPTKPISKLGDLWHLGHHRLLCADATKKKSYTILMGERKARMVFTDPPYNVQINGHVCGKGKKKHGEFQMASGEMSEAQFREFLTTVTKHLRTSSCLGSLHYICMDWRHMRELLDAGKNYTELKNLCVWNKTNGGMGSLYRSKHELVFIFKHGTKAHINNVELGKNGRYRTNVWDYAGVNTFQNTKDLDMHPTVKPAAMIKDAIMDCTKRGDIVLDVFGGSGSTLIAAEDCNRKAYLMEIDPGYVDVILQRYWDHTGIEPVHENGSTFFEIMEARSV
jgi:DNA modification methylase